LLVFGTVVAILVGIVLAVRFLRVPANRQRLVERIEGVAVLAPVLALGRRLRPQARFLWARVTPGGLGLEFTSLMAALSVALFVLIAYASVVSEAPGPTPGDAEAIDVVAGLQAAWLTEIAKLVTVLGSGVLTTVVAIAAAVALAIRRAWVEVAVLVAALVILHIAVPVLKEAIDRPRPEGGLVDANGSSFPSGHAAYAVIYTWLALTIAVRVRPGLTHATALVSIGIALTVVVGLSRVYLDVHYLSDVSAGWALGVAAFAGCAAVAMAVSHLRQNPLRGKGP
jgi:undecaprenyl-diphosphatase